MLSVRFDQFGEPVKVLHVIDESKPVPEAGEVLVRMQARPIHPADLLTVRGRYGSLPELPATPGLEGMGIVEATGPGVSAWTTGQRVIPLGVGTTWQDYLIATEHQLIPVPDTISNGIAAQFVVNPFTAWIMITEELNVVSGQWLLQTAAGSTLGRVVIQIAKLKGIKTINVVRRRDQVEELKTLGGDEVICTADENLVSRVKEITGNKGVSAAIDAVGGQTASDVMQSLGRYGVMLSYGLLSGNPVTVDAGQMIFKCSVMRGFWLRDWFLTVPAERQRAVAVELLGLMETGAIAPPVEAEYTLSDVIAAVAHAERSGRQGKVLLVN